MLPCRLLRWQMPPGKKPGQNMRRTAASRSACAAIDDARWASRYASDRDVRARLMRCARSSLTTFCTAQHDTQSVHLPMPHACVCRAGH